MRIKIQTRCVPPSHAARHIGVELPVFIELRPQLELHGFPLPDPVTGNYDVEAIDRYLKKRNQSLFEPGSAGGAVTDRNVFRGRLSAMRNDG